MLIKKIRHSCIRTLSKFHKKRYLTAYVIGILFLKIIIVLLLPERRRSISKKWISAHDHGMRPSDVENVYQFSREQRTAEYHRRHEFNRPMVIKSYIRRRKEDEMSSEIHLFLTGISMGKYMRNLSIIGCLLGENAYGVSFFAEDVAVCNVDHPIIHGDSITAILVKDEVFHRAMLGPVQLFHDYVGIIEPGDVTDLHSSVKLYGALSTFRHDELATIRSSEIYDGREDIFDWSKTKEVPRYRLCLVTQISPSTNYLPHWIDYHRKLGVDMVFVVDNNARKDLKKFYAHREDVKVLYWPWSKTQTQSFAYFSIIGRPRCQWILFSDVDEYIMLGIGNNLEKYKHNPPLWQYIQEKKKKGYNNILFRYIFMENSGYQFQVIPIPEKYIHRSAVQDSTTGKSICETDNEWVASHIHFCSTRNYFMEGNSNDAKYRFKDYGPMNLFPSSLSDPGSIIHFKRLSWEDEVLRWGYPRSSVMSTQNNNSGKVLDVNKPPKAYIKIRDGSIRYTFFRKMFNNVLRSLTSDFQVWS